MNEILLLCVQYQSFLFLGGFLNHWTDTGGCDPAAGRASGSAPGQRVRVLSDTALLCTPSGPHGVWKGSPVFNVEGICR